MTITFERLPNAGTAGIKSRYTVLVDGHRAGEVWQVAGRSFSGAWHASEAASGRITSRHSTRADAAEWVAKVAAWWLESTR